VSRNRTGSSRTASITIANKVFTVSQQRR
jgi:hypothetical protein